LQNSKIIIFYSGPCVIILIIIISWTWFNYKFNEIPTIIKILIILAIIRLISYGFILTRWGSNTKYSLIGGYRTVAQIISYEVCLIFFVLILSYLTKTLRIEKIKLIQENIWIIWIFLPIFFRWLLLILAETNRTPFDLAEGESEIVSGFNIEYRRGLFALIFIREYGIIIFLRFLTTVIFLGTVNIIIKTFILCIMFIIWRCSFPRIRYDKLIIISWKIILPTSICFLTFYRSL